MITFLPENEFLLCAKCLDDKRLGKQRVEAMQLVNALNNPLNKWRNHPACLMWKHYEKALMVYTNAMIYEWKNRGFVNTMEYYDVKNLTQEDIPFWINNDEFHASHQSILLQKKYEHYKQFEHWTHFAYDAYIWPVRSKQFLHYRKIDEEYYVHELFERKIIQINAQKEKV